MTRTLWTLVAALLASLALTPRSAAAQVPALQSDAVMQMLPVLRLQVAQAAAARAEVAELGKTGTDYFKTLDDIGAGKADPLNWLKGQSASVPVPPNARYEAQLSRWVSSKRLLEPVAIYSFGLAAAEGLAPAALARRSPDTWLKSAADQLNSPAGKKVLALRDAVGVFYASKQFSGPRQELAYEFTYSSADKALDALLFLSNPFDGGVGAPKVGGGPILEVKLNPAKNPMGRNVTPAQLATALERIGLTQEAYDANLAALFAARKDAEEPAGLVLPPDLPPEIAKDLGAMLAARRLNAVVYQLYAAQLTPLLDQLGL